MKPGRSFLTRRRHVDLARTSGALCHQGH
ncbi:putative leader peptide [Streptomyces poonensis]